MLIWILASGLVAQNQRRPWRSSTRPPESNDRGLRELTAEEIPPNLNFYAMDPLYNPDVVLGWAEERIEEKLGHGGRFYLGDIDPNYPGMECAGGRHFYTAGGQKLDGPVPPQDFLVWWDADLLREICSRRRIYKWKGGVLSDIPGSVQQITDILGDWREEIVTYTSGELRIYSTIIPASDRRACLMQDPLYRNDVTHRSMGYSHYPMTSYNLGVSSGGSAEAALAIGKVKETYAQ